MYIPTEKISWYVNGKGKWPHDTAKQLLTCHQTFCVNGASKLRWTWLRTVFHTKLVAASKPRCTVPSRGEMVDLDMISAYRICLVISDKITYSCGICSFVAQRLEGPVAQSHVSPQIWCARLLPTSLSIFLRCRHRKLWCMRGISGHPPTEQLLLLPVHIWTCIVALYLSRRHNRDWFLSSESSAWHTLVASSSAVVDCICMRKPARRCWHVGRPGHAFALVRFYPLSGGLLQLE